jgi:hypothetical protein
VLSVTCFRLWAWRNPSQVDGSRRTAGGAALSDLSGEPPAVSTGAASRLPGGRGVRDLLAAVAIE